MSERKNGPMPRLRFPEFREAGEWEEKPLSQCCDMQAGKFVRADDIHERSATNRYPCYGGNGLRGYTSTFSHSGTYPLIGRQGAQCGNINLASGRFHATEHAVVVSPNWGIDTIWLFYMLIWMNLNQHATGQAQPGLSVENLEKLTAQVPSGEVEQQKVASCLSSLDALIAAQADKLDALKTHKQGLMQRLFPREGETVPRLRFPEFREAGEWEVKKAGLLFSNRIENGEDGLPIYSVTMNDGLAKRDSLDRKIDDIALSSGNKKVHKHDIAYNMMRMWQGASGFAVEDCMVSPAYVVLAPTHAVCAEFYGYFLKLPQALDMLTAHSQGLTKDRLRLYYKDFAQIPLPKPSLAEQQRVADCLSSVDALIAAQAEKLDALKVHKQGLMQQLFPSPEAVAA